jgi:FdhD protein
MNAAEDFFAEPEGTRGVAVEGCRGGRAFAAQETVAVEAPVALEFNGVSHAVMLATPRDLHDFGLGFSLSEGILDSVADLLDIEIAIEREKPESAGGITLGMRISGGCFARLKEYRRTLAGRTGCGLCGTESLSQALRPVAPVTHAFSVEAEAVSRGLAAMRALQPLHQATGAVHAAAWCDAQGEVLMLREDVGRHNALDKLVGALARAGMRTDNGFALVTSRASFEMVQKSAQAGMAVLAAISAPTSLAIDTAKAANVALIGFARERDLSVYSHPERVRLAPKRVRTTS